MERRVVITGLGKTSTKFASHCIQEKVVLSLVRPVRMQASVLLFVLMCPRLI